MLKGVKLLAQQHKMNPKALDDRLVAARKEYLQNKESTVPTKETVKLVLGPIAKQAQELQTRIRDLLPKPEDNKPLNYLILQSLDYVVDGDSILGNLSIELQLLADWAAEVMEEWDKPKSKDTARNMAILRITQAWKRLTNKPATFVTDLNKKSSDDPDNPAPKYYNGNRHGEFLDFLTTACGIVEVKGRSGLPISDSAAARHFVDLKGKHPDML